MDLAARQASYLSAAPRDFALQSAVEFAVVVSKGATVAKFQLSHAAAAADASSNANERDFSISVGHPQLAKSIFSVASVCLADMVGSITPTDVIRALAFCFRYVRHSLPTRASCCAAPRASPPAEAGRAHWFSFARA